MIRENDLYIEMDDELNVAMQFKGTKCILSSRVPKRDEIETGRHFDVASHNEWNPDSVRIFDLRKISQLSKNDTR